MILAIEKCHHTRPKTPLDKCVCVFCHIGANEDEVHILSSCPLYNDKRKTWIVCNFKFVPSSDKIAMLSPLMNYDEHQVLTWLNLARAFLKKYCGFTFVIDNQWQFSTVLCFLDYVFSCDTVWYTIIYSASEHYWI